MAGELQNSFQLNYSKDGDAFNLGGVSQTKDVADSKRVQGVQEIGTTEEALALGDVSANGGAFYARNLDATNFVEIGLTGSYVIKLLPGEFCFLSGLSNRNLYAKADTATVKLTYAMFSP